MRPARTLPAFLALPPIAAALCLHCAAAAPTPLPNAGPTPAASASTAASTLAPCSAQSPDRQKADALRAGGHLLQAAAALRASLKQCPQDPEATVRLAETCIELGRFDEARALLDGAAARPAIAEVRSAWDTASRRLAEQSAAWNARPRDGARSLEQYRTAILADAAGDHARARQGFFDAWMASSGRADYLIDAALSARALGDAVAARKLFDRASSDLESQFGPSGIAPDPSARFGSSYLSPTLSSDSRYVVTTTGDEVAVYDTRTWHRRWRYIDYTYPHPVVVRMSPDDTLVAIANANGSLHFVDVATAKLVRKTEGRSGSMLDLAFRADGAVVATTSDDSTVRLWEVSTGKLLQELKAHTAAARRVVFSPDGSKVITTSEDKTARIWNATTGALLRTLEGHTGPVRGVSLRSDGKWAVTSSDDKTVRIWDVETGRELRVLKGHSAAVWRVAFHPDGSKVASFSDDHTIREWNASSGDSIRVIPTQNPKKGIAAASEPPPQQEEDSLRLASQGNLPILGGGGSGSSLGYRSVVVVDVMYRGDGRLLAFDIDASTRDLAALYWDADQGRSIFRFGPSAELAGGMAFDADAGRLAVALFTGALRVWDLAKGSSHELISVSDRSLRSLAWIPTRNRLAVGDAAGMVFLVDPTGVARSQQLGGDGSTVHTLAASRDGKLLVSVSEKGELRIWNVEDGKLVRSMTDRALTSAGPAAISADGMRLVVGYPYHGPAMIDLASGSVSWTAKDKLGAALIGFTPDGAGIAQLGEDGTYALFDGATGAIKATAPGSNTAVHFCTWVKAMRGDGQATTCVEPRRTPRFWSAGSQRLPTRLAASPAADLAASSSLLAGIELWRPSRDGELVKLIYPGNGKQALVMTAAQAELFGDEARLGVLCTWGDYRTAFEVCEDRFTGKDLIARALKP